MVLTVYLLVAGVGVALASARQPRDVNRYLVRPQAETDQSHRDQYSGRDVERPNIDYRRSVKPNRQLPYSLAPVIQPVYSDGNRPNTDYSYVTESDHVALISEKLDSSNNIGNEGIEFKLRTNAYPTKSNEITEYTTESINENRQRDRVNAEGRNVESNYGESGISRKESPRSRSENGHSSTNHRSLNSGPQMRYVPHEAQPNVNTDDSSITNVMHVKTNRGHTSKAAPNDRNRGTERASDRHPDSSNISTNYSRGSAHKNHEDDRDRVPAEKEEQEPWVWGSEPDLKAKSTEPDDLDDRAAFDGAGCATGYVKVQGICVEKH